VIAEPKDSKKLDVWLYKVKERGRFTKKKGVNDKVIRSMLQLVMNDIGQKLQIKKEQEKVGSGFIIKS
jgi:hypothetical protein